MQNGYFVSPDIENIGAESVQNGANGCIIGAELRILIKKSKNKSYYSKKLIFFICLDYY